MYHLGANAEILAGQRGLVAAAAQATRKGGAEAIAQIGAGDRVERRDVGSFGRRVGDFADITIPRDAGGRRDRADQRGFAPSSAFLAQYIAQEVTPEDPGLDSYRAGARAYLSRHESTMAFLGAETRVDIFV